MQTSGDSMVPTAWHATPADEVARLLGGGVALRDTKLRVVAADPQFNDTYVLRASVLPGQTITQASQAFAIAICGRVE